MLPIQRGFVLTFAGRVLGCIKIPIPLKYGVQKLVRVRRAVKPVPVRGDLVECVLV